MELTMRWFGPQDPVELWKLRQVPNLNGVVTALHQFAPGEAWTAGAMQALREQVEATGLRISVIESIPVHEDIKLGNSQRDHHIAAWIDSLRVVVSAGIRTVCYNFMPVFDWTRTDLAYKLPDGSTTLIFRQGEIEQLRIGEGDLSLPGWAEAFTAQQLTELKTAYRSVDAAKLRENLVYFLQAVVPEAARLGVRLAIHPDDPPWPVLGLPRVVSTADDLRFILNAVPNEHNGLTFCLGSLGSRADNDLSGMAEEFASRIHFVHARNVRRQAEWDFDEVPHVSHFGSTNLARVVMRLQQLRPEVPIRPDHGRMIWGETGRAGYGLYDRALGAMYLQGLMDAVDDPSADTKRWK